MFVAAAVRRSAVGSVDRDRSSGRSRRSTRPGCGGPTRAGARCTSRGCSPSSSGRRARSARGTILMPPVCAPPRSPAPRSGFMLHEPLLAHQRLDDRAAALAVADRSACTARPSRAALAPRGRRRSRSRASKRSMPAYGPASSFIVPSRFDRVDDRQAVALADLEVDRVVAGRHLQRAGAELRARPPRRRRSGSRALDERQQRLAPDDVRCSARPRGAPRRPCRRRSSPAASSR